MTEEQAIFYKRGFLTGVAKSCEEVYDSRMLEGLYRVLDTSGYNSIDDCRNLGLSALYMAQLVEIFRVGCSS